MMVSVKESLRCGTSVWTSCSAMYSRQSPLHASETTSSETILIPRTRCVRATLWMSFLELSGCAAGLAWRRGTMRS